MSQHYEKDRVECSCGEIYANNKYLKLHIFQAEYNCPVFSQSSEKELKESVTYQEFIKQDVDFIIAPYKSNFSILRKESDIRFRDKQ